MLRTIIICLALTGCTGRAWNTTVADNPQVRDAMLASVHPGETTEKRFAAQWGLPTQKFREGAQMSYVYRNMSNPPGYYAPQFGNSSAFVIAVFQHGLAVGAYSSDTQGCRATFGPRPPGQFLDNPSTVHTVNCGVHYDGSSERRPIAEGINWLIQQGRNNGLMPPAGAFGIPTIGASGSPLAMPNVPPDIYVGEKYE